MTDNGKTSFDPTAHLTRLKGNDYLEVKWRLVWLRDKHPAAQIETTLHTFDEQMAVFQARIDIPDGGSATGWGSETRSDFPDYLEKAETKAIGRALAALGFGTQFAPDHEFGAEAGRVVDAPVARPQPPAARQAAAPGIAARSRAVPRPTTPRPAEVDLPVTQQQLHYLAYFAQVTALPPGAVEKAAQMKFKKGAGALTQGEAEQLIVFLVGASNRAEVTP